MQNCIYSWLLGSEGNNGVSSEHHGEEVSTEKSLSVHNVLKWHWFHLYTSMHAIRTGPVAHIQRNVYSEFKTHMYIDDSSWMAFASILQ